MSAAPRTVNAFALLRGSHRLQRWQYQSRPLGPADVEVAISHCAIALFDVECLDGYASPPCVPGHEIAGTVTAIGQQVEGLSVGDRVGVGAQVWACLNRDVRRPCHACASGQDQNCPHKVYAISSRYEDGVPAHGGFADFIRVQSDFAFKLPEALPNDLAAPIMCAGLTVFSPLKAHGAKPGARVGIAGIGGLGHLGLQFVRAMGGTPVALSRSAAKRGEALALGGPSAEFVDLSDRADCQKVADSLDLLVLTGASGSQSYRDFLRFMRPQSTIVSLAGSSGRITTVKSKDVSVVGSVVGSIQDAKDMLAIAAAGDVRPVIEKLPMEQANEGIARVRAGEARYCVVLEN